MRMQLNAARKRVIYESRFMKLIRLVIVVNKTPTYA